MIEEAVAVVGFCGPTAFGEPEVAAHDELHSVGIAGDGGLAGDDHLEFGVVLVIDVVVEEGLFAAAEDGENDNGVGVYGLVVLGIEDAGRSVDGGFDFAQGVGVENIVGVEVDDVIALGLANAEVADGVSPVFVILVHAGDGDGEADGGVQEWAVVVEEDFEVFEGLCLQGLVAAAENSAWVVEPWKWGTMMEKRGMGNSCESRDQ